MKHTQGKWQTWVVNGTNFLTNEGQVAIMSDSSENPDAQRICLVDAQDQSVKKKDKWTAPDQEREANAKLICSTYNYTIGRGINPESVGEIMKDAKRVVNILKRAYEKGSVGWNALNELELSLEKSKL